MKNMMKKKIEEKQNENNQHNHPVEDRIANLSKSSLSKSTPKEEGIGIMQLKYSSSQIFEPSQLMKELKEVKQRSSDSIPRKKSRDEDVEEVKVVDESRPKEKIKKKKIEKKKNVNR